ncbi:MAG TPA: LytTR family DNA-binding domain-containing protein [Bacteroidia bacterium]|jgi:two-component system LytT family response regulator|nr:LytTR family DNA-binding domain-containing protein [Bacteroidia bacterium]
MFKTGEFETSSSLTSTAPVFRKTERESHHLAPRKVAINSASGMLLIELENIIFLQSDGPYTTIYSEFTDKIVSSRNLKEFDDLLSPYGFFRIHRSYLVNLLQIVKYVKADGGYVIMSNGERVDVSTKKKEELLEKLATQVLFL